jgi:glycosyltransferase 2 family protein
MPSAGSPSPFTRGRKVLLAATALAYLAGAAAIYALVDEDTLRAALSLPASLIAALLGLSLVNYAVRTWRWLAFGRQLGIGVPAPRNAAYYLAGFALTATPGKAGEAIRLWFLKRGHGVPYLRSLPMLLADRMVDLWAALILSIAGMAAFAQYRWQGVALAAVIVAVSIPILFPLRFLPLLGALRRVAPHRARLLARLRRLMRAMGALSSWRTYGLTLAPTLGGWFAEGAALYLLLRHMGGEIGLLSAVFVFSFAMIVGALSMLPGGLGSTEAAMVILLGALGVDLHVALASTAIVRITTLWFAVAIGVAIMPAAVRASSRPREVAAEPRTGVA